jgi:hypothetical protein
VRPQNLPHNFPLHAVRDASARARQKAANLLVDLPLELRLDGVDQTASQSPELGGDALGGWRHAIAAQAEIPTVCHVGQRTNLILIMALDEIYSFAMFEAVPAWQENHRMTKDVVSAYG